MTRRDTEFELESGAQAAEWKITKNSTKTVNSYSIHIYWSYPHLGGEIIAIRFAFAEAAEVGLVILPYFSLSPHADKK